MAKKKVTFEELLGFKKMQKISLERLTPPKALPPELMEKIKSYDIKPISSGKSVEQVKAESERRSEVSESQEITDSKLGIDYETIARSSEFQRFIYFLLTGKTHRGKQRDLRRDVTVKMTKFRGSGMGDVINEFKAKVARLRGDGE